MRPVAGSVLVVEDEREIRELLRRYLERAGLPVLTAAGGAEAIRMLNEGAARLVLLDLGLPDVDGEEVLRAARAAGEVPVIVLTARSAAEDRIRGLTLGADDYVTKPFSPTEVVLRVQAVLHRAGRNGEEPGAACYGGGRLRVDQDRHEAVLDGRPLDLTPTEWGLLTALATVPGRVYSRYELVNRVRGYEFEGYERIIDSHVKNLRHKLGAAGPRVVETVPGVGYRLGLRRDP
jgi:DNA-binding response OmpR family regulator